MLVPIQAKAQTSGALVLPRAPMRGGEVLAV